MSAFAKRVVGIERPEAGRDAIALAVALGGASGIVLVHAYPFADEPPPQFAAEGEVLHAEAERELAELRDATGVDAEIVAVPDIRPERALHRVAEERDADLLVVGASHHGPIGRALLGDVSRAVLHGAPCPVAVAPRGYQDHAAAPQTIGVGYDERPESERALRVAEAAAAALKARLLVLRVVTPPEAFPLIPLEIKTWRELTEELAGRARASLNERIARLHVPAEAEVLVDEQVGWALAQASERVDLLVCGSRGWGTPQRVILGGTSEFVIHHAACPVVVAPRTGGEQAA